MSVTHSGHWTVPLRNERRVPPGEASALLAALRGSAGHDQAVHANDLETAAVRPSDLRRAYRRCAELTRVHSRTFFFSSQFLPAEKRRAIRAFYALCRTSDDLVDQPTGEASRTLARWVGWVQAPRPPADHPVLLAWDDTVRRYQVPQSLVDELLAGVAMDLTVKRYATFDALWLYCYRVAAVVGLAAMHMIGAREGAAPYAIDLGIALQLTNILRDVGEDAARGRVYLPLEDLERFGLTDADILGGVRDGRFRALMDFEIARAHALYEAAWPGIVLLSPDSQFAVGAAAEVYRGILDKIVANDYDVYGRRAHLTLADKLLLMPRIWRRLHAPQRADGPAR